MQQHIPIRMGLQPLTIRNRNTANNNRIALAEGMNIKALTNSHNQLRENSDIQNRLRIKPARSRSAGTVILILSGRPSTSTGILPENSIAEDSSVTGCLSLSAVSNAETSME